MRSARVAAVVLALSGPPAFAAPSVPEEAAIAVLLFDEDGILADVLLEPQGAAAP